MRFHEFYRIEDNKVVEVQALWDIPQLMMQAGVWPMVPSLGWEWNPPAPASNDGLVAGTDIAQAQASLNLVGDMLTGLSKHATGGVEAMELEKYWHEKCSWYGPSGIGTARGIQGFRNWHQIPFLNALPNRRTKEGMGYLFADKTTSALLLGREWR
ncbi:hypothetical protein JCM19236_590 [Vibrio sp. JCM 19236]|nr:hypothetical protein JCM19236_590 [Vibrio sp. JCM 19236]